MNNECRIIIHEKEKYLTFCERGKIEAYLKAGYTKKKIADEIGVSERTLYREIKRGTITLKNSDLTERTEYLSDYAHWKYEENQSRKEGSPKIGKNHTLASKIEKLIMEEKYFP